MITLSDLIDAGESQVSLEKSIAMHEEALSTRKEEHRKLTQETLPNMMAEIGLMSFRLANGKEIGITDQYYAKLPEDNYAAFTWLREKGMDGVIKTQIILDFSKGDDELVQQIQDELALRGLIPTVKSTIHHMTLKALVKEQVERGNDIPLDAFGAGSFRQSIVKK